MGKLRSAESRHKQQDTQSAVGSWGTAWQGTAAPLAPAGL